MNAVEQEQFMVRLAVLAEIYGEPMSPTRLEGYTQLLAGESMDELVPALEACAKVCTFFPKPIDILDAIVNVRYEREQVKTKQALIAAEAYDPRRIEGITEEQWQERWAALKRVFANAPQKPHRPLVYPCICNDCTREHREKPKPLVPPCFCSECVTWEATHAAR